MNNNFCLGNTSASLAMGVCCPKADVGHVGTSEWRRDQARWNPFFHCKMRCRSYLDCRTFCYSWVPEGIRTIHARLLVDCCTHHVELCGEQRSVMLLVCCLDMARSAHLGGQRRQASCGIMWIAKVCHVCCLDMARSAQLGGQRRSANFENGWVQHRELATATLPRIEQGRVDSARWTETASVDGLPWVCVKSYYSQYEINTHP